MKHLDLHITSEYLETKSKFPVAATLAVNILFRTQFINRHNLGTFPNKLKVAQRESQLAAILSSSSEAIHTSLYTDAHNNTQVTTCDVNAKVAEKLWVPVQNVTPATVVSTGKCLLWFETNLSLTHHRLLSASGIVEVIPNVLFQVLPTKVFYQRLHIAKHMLLGQLCQNLTNIFELRWLLSTGTNQKNVLWRSVQFTLKIEVDTRLKVPIPWMNGETRSTSLVIMPQTASKTSKC